jgi:hypothetical protein
MIAWALTLLAAALALPAASGEEQPCGPVYRLYRTSAASADLPGRIHVATFDSCEIAAAPENNYNSSNCEIARSLFQRQPGVTVTYWCERVR